MQHRLKKIIDQTHTNTHSRRHELSHNSTSTSRQWPIFEGNQASLNENSKITLEGYYWGPIKPPPHANGNIK